MKRLVALLVAIIMLSPVCGLSEPVATGSPAEAMISLNAMDILNALIDAKYPVFSAVDFDENTDPNGILGRPNAYTSKASALDLRISNKASNEPFDIDVEVFALIDDCTSRKKYIESVYKEVPIFAMYMYSYANVLFRADFRLVPSEAEEYNKALGEILGGKAVTPYKALPQTEIVLAEDISTKENPALIGNRITITQDGRSIALTILNVLRGKAAAMFTKSFNRYNNSKSILPKGKEWILLYLRVEALEGSSYPIDLSDSILHIVSKNGTDNGFSMMMDNPNPMKSMYAKGIQHCWFGIPVDKNDKTYLTITDGTYASYWFDLSTRQIVDTSNLVYPQISKKDTGETVEAMQMMLVEYGYLQKLPRGVFDSNTISALKKFQKAVGLKPTGIADNETLRLLFSGKPIGNN